MAPGSGKHAVESLEATQAVHSTDQVDPEMHERIARNSQEGPFGLQAPVVWLNVVIMVVLHALAAAGVVVGASASWKSWWLCSVFYVISGLGVTAGAHRLWAHKTYKARMPLQVLLMLFNCVSFQNDILVWSRDHRVHHKFSETDADPHNAKRGFFFAHVGWLLMRKHPDVLIKGKTVDLSDLKKNPVVMFQHRYYLPLSFLMALFLPLFIPWYFWSEHPLTSFLIVVLRYVLLLHTTWLVNSAAHMWGGHRYDKHTNPSENRFVSFTAGGEGFHNYHHTFPYDYSTSEWGSYLNLTTAFIDILAALGLAYDRKQVSQEAIERVRRRKGDLSE